jgi:peptidoglycan hydrolase-like protein with peptidoglycan-binding domain
VDGGASWAAQSSGSGSDLAAVAFADPGRGVVAGAAGSILTTSTGGSTDPAAPKTTASGLQKSATTGWRHTRQTVALKARDAGSGVAATYYTLGSGGRQTYAGAFDITAAGSHVVKYWSVDWAGNVEPKRTGYVNIDYSKPVCKAVGNVTAYTGMSVKFAFRINDAKPTCGFGTVRISIQKNGQTKQRIVIGRAPFNVTRSYSAVLKQPAGRYTWVVTATDLAGNVQQTKGHARLTLKQMPLPTFADVQRRLIQLKYLPAGAVTGKADYRTSQALMAFQAWSGLSRDGVAGVATRKKLTTASVPTPRSTGAGGHSVQVFRNLGVALCVDNGTLVRAVHCSTGRAGLETTAGTWSVYLKSVKFWSQAYSSWMPYASFFHNGEGLHGYGDVPPYPASHGCVRLPMPEAPWVYEFAYTGATVNVF